MNLNKEDVMIDKVTIKRDLYLQHSLCLTPKEISIIEDFSQWLPSEIIDCHSHCNLPDHVLEMDSTVCRHMFSTFPSFSLEESKAVKELFYPGKKVHTLRFPNAFRGINHRKANQYLVENSPRNDRIALFGLPEDVKYTISMLLHTRISALKMYHAYTNPPAFCIYDFFLPEILEVVQSLGIPIILHLPTKITQSLDDLLRLTADFPKLKIVVAHLGLTKFPSQKIVEICKELVDYPQIKFDTALCPSIDVVRIFLEIIGCDRIMFGSDEPLNLIRSKAFIHPLKGERIVTEFPYHWVDSIEHQQYKGLAKDSVHCHWSSLSAIRCAIEFFHKSVHDEMKRKIFYENAKFFFGF